MNENPVQGVVPDGERFPLPAEQHLLMRDQAGHAHRVHVDLVHGRAARAGHLGHGGVRRRAEARLGAGRADHRRGAQRRPRRGVRLGRVVQLDDLGRGEEAGRLLGEAHHQDGADGEVRHDQDARGLALVQPALHLVQPVLAEPGGADHDVHVVLDAPAQVVHDRAGTGEVDHHVAPGQRVPVIAQVDLGGDVQIRGLADRADHLAPHPPACAHYADLDHRDPPVAQAWKAEASSKGPTTARALGRVSTCAAISRTSSWVTASMAASTSSTGSSRG